MQTSELAHKAFFIMQVGMQLLQHRSREVEGRFRLLQSYHAAQSKQLALIKAHKKKQERKIKLLKRERKLIDEQAAHM